MKNSKSIKKSKSEKNKNSTKQPFLNDNQNNSKESNSIDKKHKIGTINEVDEYMRHNEFILRGYRINFNSVKKIIKSLFMIHN
jgi:adiponectin receptor